MLGLYVAATVVTLLQFVRRGERRVLPLLGLFTGLTLARYLGAQSAWATGFEVASIAAGLVLLAMLTPRHTPVR
jgi:hypothetical protein